MKKPTSKEVASTVTKIAELVDDNLHTQALIEVAELIGDEKNAQILQHIEKIHSIAGHLPYDLYQYRYQVRKDLLENLRSVTTPKQFLDLKKAGA